MRTFVLVVLPAPITLGRRKARMLADVSKFLLGLPDERSIKN